MPWSTDLRNIPPKESELEHSYAKAHGHQLGLLPGAVTPCASGQPRVQAGQTPGALDSLQQGDVVSEAGREQGMGRA